MMDIENICRTCLGLSGPLLSIYDGGSSDGNAGCLADMLRDFTKTKPQRSDKLPEKVCLTCISEINRCYSFKKKCENSNRTLRQLLPDAEPELVDDVILKNITFSTEHKAVQTIRLECKDQTQQTDKINSLASRKNSSAKLDEDFELSTKTTLKLIELDDVEVDADAEAEADVYEIADVDDAAVEEERDGSSIILQITEDADKYKEMIYDECTGELTVTQAENVQNSGELLNVKTGKSKNEFSFRIYNNEHGETEIAPSTVTRSQGKSLLKRGRPSHWKDSPKRKIPQSIKVEEPMSKTSKNQTQKEAASPNTESSTLPRMEYYCELCNAGFAMPKSLLIHRRQKNCTAKSFKCSECDRVFDTEEHLMEHKITHQLYNCTECQEVFDQKEELGKHMISKHKRSMRNQCNVCQKVFTMLSALRDHMRIHTGEKPFVCTICNKSFTQSANLRQHMFRHSDIKRFKCENCPNTFVTKAELESHNRVHTGDKPYKCDVCEARFTTSCSLIKHKRKHTGERPYACDICPMRFTALNVLKNHRRTHTGEKPYQCPHCNKTFRQKGDCLLHQRQHDTANGVYLCPICNEMFKNMTIMRGHLKEHNIEEQNTVHQGILDANAKINNGSRDSIKQEDDIKEQLLEKSISAICS